MSLVGPRPCLSYETDYFAAHHFERFLAPPGITGLWQVTARAHASFAEALEMDVAYVRNWSLGLDLSLILRTPAEVFPAEEGYRLMATLEQGQASIEQYTVSANGAGDADARVRVGVVGLGYWGPNLVRVLNEAATAEAAWMCDLRPELLEALGRRFPSIRQTQDLDEMLDDDSVEAVAVVTPVSTHHDLAMRALTAGKHVFVEKPLASHRSWPSI